MRTNDIFGRKFKIAHGDSSVFDWFEKIKEEILAEESDLTYKIRKSRWEDSEKYPCEFIKIIVSKEYEDKEEEFVIQIDDNVDEIYITTSHYLYFNNIWHITHKVEKFLVACGFETVDYLWPL